MLETFVPSRIRRVLLEHLLAHPEGRFYLRGLAKELDLPISPLRRELIRLEQLGVLKATQEANVRFYVVDQTAPNFASLKPAQAALGLVPEPASQVTASSEATSSAGEANGPLSPSPSLSPSRGEDHTQREQLQIERLQQVVGPMLGWLKRPSRAKQLTVAALLVGLGMVCGVVALMSVAPGGKESVMAWLFPGLSQKQASAAPGEMRSGRWRLAPAAMEGFAGPGREGNR